jgi:hypothetical protein
MPEWKKVLYEKNDLPDDYVTETFLKDLRKNGKSLMEMTTINKSANSKRETLQYLGMHDGIPSSNDPNVFDSPCPSGISLLTNG